MTKPTATCSELRTHPRDVDVSDLAEAVELGGDPVSVREWPLNAGRSEPQSAALSLGLFGAHSSASRRLQRVWAADTHRVPHVILVDVETQVVHLRACVFVVSGAQHRVATRAKHTLRDTMLVMSGGPRGASRSRSPIVTVVKRTCDGA